MPKQSNHQIICEYYHWNLFQRDDVYYADGRLNHPNLGKHSLGTRDRYLAMSALRELDRKMAASRQGIHPRPDDNIREISIEQVWEQYLTHVARPDVLGGTGPRTQQRYRAVRAKHQVFCLEQSVQYWNDVDKKHVVAYGAYLHKEGYADGTVYLELTLIKQVVKWLIEEEKVLPESHRIRLALRRSEQSDTFCYSREQIRAMVELCHGDPKLLHWLADVIVGLATTGMRAGELASLRWSDVDLVSNIITLPDNRHSGRHQDAGAVRTTKGRRTRRLPIHARLRQVLETLAHRSDGRVFSGPDGGRFLPDSACRIFIRDVIEPLKVQFPTPTGEIGFESGRLHSFRHAFVSQSFLDGAGEGEIRTWVGHTNSRIVERYRHLSNEDARRKMDKIDFLGDAPAPTNDEIKSADSAEKQTSAGAEADVIPKKEQGEAAGPDVPDHR